ncbi:MAG: tRNA pseudouridine(38-40) synthase TruA [Pirellulales bacterium]
MSRTLQLRLAYNGERFSGWQIQPDQRTVQGVLSDAIHSICGETVVPKGSSRTDAGVHAADQVASFTTSSPFTPDVWRRALNAHLPKDVVVLRSSEVHPSFDPIIEAKTKRYRYRIHDGDVRPVLARPFVWQWNSRLNVSAMEEASSFLIGEHDFTSFENPSSPRASKIRKVNDLTIQRRDGGEGTPDSEIWIEIEGNGFLYNMVRIIAGTLLMVGTSKRPETWVGNVLADRNRTSAGPTAPPQGLLLLQINLKPQTVTST